MPALKEAGYDIEYIGSVNGMEKGLIEAQKIPYHGISSGKLRRYFDWKNFTDPFRVLKGYGQAVSLMKKLKPDVVFSKGGFVSVPVVLAAKHCHVPAIIHESDITPGLANKIAIKGAKKVCCNFPETMKYLPADKAVLTGSPIRRELFSGVAENAIKLCNFPNHNKPVILIIGGSLGSKKVNEAVREILPELLKDFYVIHLYGKVEEVPQNENTPFHPYSPYAVAKQYGYWIVREYRDAYHMFACNGILFNHESERRGETFVTRKITLAANRIKQGKQDKLYLGNLSSRRDWGYAKDYVECMWLILQNEKPSDFVIATGVQHTVREFATLAFHYVGIELEWRGEGIDEKGVDKATGKVLVEVSPDFYRPTDVVNLWGDPTKAKAELGWNPNKTSFEELVKLMVVSDMKKVAADDAASRVRVNLEEYLEKGIVK